MDRDPAGDPGQLTLFDEPPPTLRGVARRILLGGEAIEYRFERRRRRTIGLRVNEQGLEVAAPLRAPWRVIEAFLREKERWILRQLEAWREIGAPRTLYGETGETLPYLGTERVLCIGAGPRTVRLQEDRIEISDPQPHRRGAILAQLRGWLKSRALELLAPRVGHYAARLALPAPDVRVSGARRQWGACGANGRIRLSWRLVHLAPELGDYVAAHEVAHLVEMNHSARFWNLVEWLYPHWREARGRIERAAATLPRL